MGRKFGGKRNWDGGEEITGHLLWLSQQRILTEPGHGGGFLFGDNGYSDQSGRCIRPDCRCIHGLRVPVLPPPASHAIARGWLAAAGACCHAVTTAAAAAVAAAAQRLPPRARLFISFKRSHLLHAAVASANPAMVARVLRCARDARAAHGRPDAGDALGAPSSPAEAGRVRRRHAPAHGRGRGLIGRRRNVRSCAAGRDARWKRFVCCL